MPLFLRPRVIWTLALLALASPGPAATYLAEGYSIRVWHTDDGLPQNLVTSAVQTQDGYLWFGTASGLARFNGERFQVFDVANSPGLQDRRITSLFEDARGDLWIGHEAGLITRYRNGRFEPFRPSSGATGERVIGLGSDEQGRLWAMRESGAVDSLDDGSRLPSLIAPERPGIMGWSRTAAGHIWVTENGQAARLTAGKLEATSLPVDPPHETASVAGIAGAADGGVWILQDDRIRKWQDDRWTEDRGEFPWPPVSLACCLELRDGTLAVGTIHSGLYLIFRDGRTVRFDRTNGLPQDWVRFLYEDREGNLWAGAGRSGLVSIHATAFSVLDAPDEFRGCSVNSVAPGRDGALWIGTDGAGVYHHAAGTWTQYGVAEGLANMYIQAVTETGDGEVWAGNFWWGGPYRLESGRFFRPEHVEETSSPVLAIVPGRKPGDLLVGTRDGLLRLNDNQATWLIPSPQGTGDDVCAVARDREGVIWCGFAQGGLARLADGKLSLFRAQDGLGSDAVQCLWPDDDGALWIGTADGGLTRFKNGQFATVGEAQGLADNIVCHILDDGLGYFWLSTHHGIQRVARDELNRCADGLIPAVSGQVYDRNDGLPIIEFTGGRQGAGCKTPDGRLWFASSKGVIAVDPARTQSNPRPPPVLCEALLVDGQPVSSAEGTVPDRLPPDHQRLEFRFCALSFVAPSKVRFKYRLDGLDKDWVDAGARRTAAYSQLPAGTYRFRVIACNNDGVWNNAGASLAFTVAPFFWQTWWFAGSGTAAVLTAVAVLVRHVTRRRLQRRLAELQRQHALERERARIAQDIHDDVGTSLARIAMLSQPARAVLAEPERTAATLARIYATAHDVTRALDEIVWAVDPRHDTLDSLVSYIGKFAQDLLGTAGIRCRLDPPVELPRWPITADTRHNLFLAFKEALNNILKHAAATEVRISLQLLPGSFVLVITDNGRGFDPDQPRASDSGRAVSGHGLVNMRTRLAGVGGRCEIQSQPHHGTSVSLIVDVADRASPLRKPPLPADGDAAAPHASPPL